MRKPFFGGNWKMNKTIPESTDFVKEFKGLVKDVNDKDIVICPPFTSLHEVGKMLKSTGIRLGAQNMYFKEEGAFTGEISPLMLKDAGCSYAVLGHSERRHVFNETDETVNKKVLAALDNGIKVIICVGETLEERESNKTFEVVKRQLAKGLEGINDFRGLVVAYEPVWAIGTGKNASPQQAEEVHKFIRKHLENENARVIYGGSVKPGNIKELMVMENVDGALVGGASLDAKTFADICKA